MPCRNVNSWNTMITGYAQVGMTERAREIFDTMPQRDSVSWAAMISGYFRGGFGEEALQLFIEMGRSGERMNRLSFTCALGTCADIAMLESGMQVHGRLVKAGYGMGCFGGNALLAMYCKCGSIHEAYEAFKEMTEGCCLMKHHDCWLCETWVWKDALEIFDMMRTTDTQERMTLPWSESSQHVAILGWLIKAWLTFIRCIE